MENSFRSIILLFSCENSQGHIHNSQGKIPGLQLLMTALRQCHCWEQLYKVVRLPEQKDSLFKMLKLIVKFLSCLRLKALKTTPRSVAHTVFIRLTALGAYSRWALIRGWALIKFSPFSASEVCLFCNKTINANNKTWRSNKARFL